MTQTILAGQPERLAPALGSASYEAAAQGGWLPGLAVDQPEQERACLLVPCDRCGASQHQSCPGGQPCGARRALGRELEIEVAQ